MVILDDGLRRRGDRTLLVHGSVGPLEASLEDLAHQRGVPVEKIPELGRRIHVWSDVSSLLKLVRLIFRVRPDIVHTHTAKAGALGRVAATLYNVLQPRGRRAAVVHTYHGHVLSGYFGPVGSAFVRLVERTLGLLTDAVVTISPEQQAELAETFHIVPRSKTRVVRLGLELAPLLELPAPTERETLVYGYVGRLVPIKDLETLVSGFADAYAQCARLRLLIAGDGESRPAIETKVRQLGLEHVVTFLGWCRDLPALYRQMDAAVLSSRNEGTPVSLIEAMAAGRPVVATRVGGVPDLVVDGTTGLLVAAGDLNAFARALLKLAEDHGERSAMGARGRQRVTERYGVGRLVDEVRAVYANAVVNRRGGAR